MDVLAPLLVMSVNTLEDDLKAKEDDLYPGKMTSVPIYKESKRIKKMTSK